MSYEERLKRRNEQRRKDEECLKMRNQQRRQDKESLKRRNEQRRKDMRKAMFEKLKTSKKTFEDPKIAKFKKSLRKEMSII